jgi:hypothetical protein
MVRLQWPPLQVGAQPVVHLHPVASVGPQMGRELSRLRSGGALIAIAMSLVALVPPPPPLPPPPLPPLPPPLPPLLLLATQLDCTSWSSSPC